MKVLNPCMECFQENGIPVFSGEGNVFQVKDDNYDIDTYFVEMTCENGHHTFTWIQAFKFEFLYDLAMREFVEERYESAIFYFGVAKERFYWFFVKVAMRHFSQQNEITDYFYKYVRNNSQMEEGIFLAMYSLLFNKQAKKFNENIQKIRNNVIHKGNLVNKEECEEYGKEVLTTIVSILNELKEQIPDFYNKEMDARFKEFHKIEKLKNYKCSTTSTECAIFFFFLKLEDNFEYLVESYKHK